MMSYHRNVTPDTDSPHPVPVPTRLVITLRALRWSALATLALAGMLWLAWRPRTTISPALPTGAIWTAAGCGAGAWISAFMLQRSESVEGAFYNDRRRAGRVIIVVDALLAAIPLLAAGWVATAALHRWVEILTVTGLNTERPLTAALICLATGGVIATDILLRGVRVHSAFTAMSADGWPPPGLPRLLRGGRGRQWALAAAAFLAPILTLGVVSQAAHNWTSAATTVTAGPIDSADLPARPHSMASEAAWSREESSLLDVAAGAAGPIILTTTDVIGLNPEDGSTRWSYHREGMTPRHSDTSNAAPFQKHYLVASPDRRYIALRLESDKKLVGRTSLVTAVILDTVTGVATGEHPSSPDGALQLTDHAVLDGETAYSLTDGSRLWSISSTGDKGHPWVGTAGSSTFILSTNATGNPDKRTRSTSPNVEGTSVGLTVVPDTDPSATTTMDGITTDPLQGGLLVQQGWVAVYSDGVPTTNTGSDTEGWSVQAASLDGLAGIEGADTRRIDMGRSVGLNTLASEASGDLVLYPQPVPWKRGSEYTSFEFTAPTAGAILDPATGALASGTTASGLAGAAVGITPEDDGESISFNLTAAPGDGSAGVRIPVDGTMFHDPRDDGSNPGLSDLGSVYGRIAPRDVTAISAPGATVLVLATGPGYLGRTSVRLYGVGRGDA